MKRLVCSGVFAFLSAGLLTSTLLAGTTGTLAGTVKSKSKEPLIGAYVIVKDLRMGTTTDAPTVSKRSLFSSTTGRATELSCASSWTNGWPVRRSHCTRFDPSSNKASPWGIGRDPRDFSAR